MSPRSIVWSNEPVSVPSDTELKVPPSAVAIGIRLVPAVSYTCPVGRASPGWAIGVKLRSVAVLQPLQGEHGLSSSSAGTAAPAPAVIHSLKEIGSHHGSGSPPSVFSLSMEYEHPHEHYQGIDRAAVHALTNLSAIASAPSP